jgi:alpha-ketoglutarate-dependent taurine dioxygenase
VHSLITKIQISRANSYLLDTMWASGYELFDKITPAFRKFLESLTATFANHRYHKSAAEKGFKLYDDERGSPQNVGTDFTASHPVVRTNPVTGWKGLFGAGHHLVEYNELSPAESQRVHQYLMSMVTESIDCQLRHHWINDNDVGKSCLHPLIRKKNTDISLAIWDNRSTFHAANADFAGMGVRTGHRVVGIAEKPYLDPRSPTRREALAAEGSLF